MATIKDVAARAGVSVTTVSIVINGKAGERRIPDSTREKVQAAMQDLGYQPNLSARRLRFSDVKKPALAFYWPADYRTNIMASFITYIQKELNARNFDCELIIQAYENDKLEKSASAIIRNSYNGCIIGAASEKDLQYLETLTPQIPVVLINRSSEKYSTVQVDSAAIGKQAASLFYQKGYREVSLFASDQPYVATGIRTRAFREACTKLGIHISEENILRTTNTITGGVEAAERFCQLKNHPQAIFLESESMALGALYTFHNNHLQVPGDVELLAVSLLSEEHSRYSIPSLSVIEMPTESIAREAISILISLLKGSSSTALHTSQEPKVVLRDSFSL